MLRILVVGLLLAPLAAPATEGADAWPEDRPFRVAVGENTPPATHALGNGSYGGWGVDMLRIGSIKLGLELELVPYNGLAAGVDLLRNGTVDAVGILGPRPDVTAFATMNEPWGWAPVVLITHERQGWTSLDEAKGTISTLPGSPLEAIVQERFGHMDYVVTANAGEAARAVANGTLDAYLGPLAIIGYQIQVHQLNRLVPVGDAVSIVESGFWAVTPEATAALDALRGAVTEDEARVIYVKWTGFDLSEPREGASGLPEWLGAAAIAVAVVLALLGIGIWLQRNQVRRAQAELVAQHERARADQAKAALDASEEMGRFRTELINRTAHQFATPMTTLVSAMASMKLRHQEEVEAGNFEAMDRNMDRLQATVRSISDVARLGVGVGATDAPGPVQLHALFAAADKRHQGHAKEVGMELDVDASELAVVARAGHVRQALDAFIDNALEHSGGTRVRVTAEAQGGSVRVTVAADGVGLSEADQVRVWEPYERLGATALAGASGRGMGLYMAKLAIKMEGGTVGCSSTGPGAVFWFELPAALD